MEVKVRVIGCFALLASVFLLDLFLQPIVFCDKLGVFFLGLFDIADLVSCAQGRVWFYLIERHIFNKRVMIAI